MRLWYKRKWTVAMEMVGAGREIAGERDSQGER